MNDKVDLVNYQEPLSIGVGSFLVSKGFSLASSIGVASSLLEKTDVLGILYEDPDVKPQKCLFGLIKQKPERMFLGTIWFSNRVRGANERNWVFEVNGREYVKLTRQLSEEMAATFNVKIVLRLVCEQPKVETYL